MNIYETRIYLKNITLEYVKTLKYPLIISLNCFFKIERMNFSRSSNGFLLISGSVLHINNSIFDNTKSNNKLAFNENSCIEIRKMLNNNNNYILNSIFTGMITSLNGSVVLFIFLKNYFLR